LENKDRWANLNLVSGPQNMMSNAATIDISAIGAFAIIEDILAILEVYQGMMTRDQQPL